MYHTLHSLPLRKAWESICLSSLVVLCAACHKETKAERYAREAKETTAQCPMAIDSNTVMDSMTYTPSTHRFTYYYKVNGVPDSVLTTNAEMLRQQILERLLNATDMIPYIQDGVTFRYVYRTDTTAEPVMDFVYESLKR